MRATDRAGPNRAETTMDAGELMRALRGGTATEVTGAPEDARARGAHEHAEVAQAEVASRARPVAHAGLVAAAAALALAAPGEYRAAAVSGDSARNSAAADAWRGLVETQGDPLVKTRKFGSDVVLGAAAAAAIAGGALAGDAVQWRVEDGGNGHWYGIQQIPLRWDESSDRARRIGAHLVTLTNNLEWEFLWGALGPIHNSTSPVWIGGYQDTTSIDYSEPSGGWRWVTDEQWKFTSWAAGCPNDNTVAGNEDAICTGSTGGWNDLAKAALCASLIEWSADCNSDGIVDYGQIRSGQLADTNGNGVPDICECSTNPGLPSCCIGDIVADRTINGADLGTLLAYWGPRTTGSFSIASDLNGDGNIDGADLGALLANWGPCPAASVPSWATLIEAQPDPAVVTDASLRAAIVATGLPWRVRDTGTGIEMLLVPPGTFQMGCVMGSDSYPCLSYELPVHQVTLTNPFYVGRFEVTQTQWTNQMGSNPSYFNGFADAGSRPIEQVSWNDIQGFLAESGMRLPTEAEWEFACRAGTQTPFYNGSTNEGSLASLAWSDDSFYSGGTTHAVGLKAANALGLHDTIGNVWEWVADGYGDFEAGAQTNPRGLDGSPYRAFRGGAFGNTASLNRASSRNGWTPDAKFLDIGFRVARNP